MSDGKINDEFEPEETPEIFEYISFSKEETMRITALTQAVKARTPNAGATEIVSEATIFEEYLTGKE